MLDQICRMRKLSRAGEWITDYNSTPRGGHAGQQGDAGKRDRDYERLALGRTTGLIETRRQVTRRVKVVMQS